MVNATPRAKIVLNKVCADAAIVFVVGAAGHADHVLEASVGVEEISPVWSVGGVAVPGDVPAAGVVGRRAQLEEVVVVYCENGRRSEEDHHRKGQQYS